MSEPDEDWVGGSRRTTLTDTSVPGMRWRTLAWDKDGKQVEQRFTPDDKVQFDELCIDDWFHIEQMDDHCYWMRIGDACVNVCVHNGKAVVMVERDEYGEETESQ